MIQLGYCVPIGVDEDDHDDDDYDDEKEEEQEVDDNDNDNVNQSSTHHRVTTTTTSTTTTIIPNRIGHNNIDWSLWDGGQIGGIPSWLNPQYIPKYPLRCKCTNIVCDCYNKDEQKKKKQNIDTNMNNNNTDTGNTNNTTTSTNEQQQQKTTTSNSSTILNFIGQFYAPLPSSSSKTNHHVFHRTIYIFACTKCYLSQCYHRIRVIRTQLSQINPYWPSTTSTNITTTDHTKIISHLPSTYYNTTGGLCRICNFPAKGKCPITQYTFCSTEHQRLYYYCCVNNNNNNNNNNDESNDTTTTTTSILQNNNDNTNTKNNETVSSLLSKTNRVLMNGIYTTMEIVVEEEPELPMIVEINDTTTNDNNNVYDTTSTTLFPNIKSNKNSNDENDDDEDDDDDDDDDENIEQEDLNSIIGKTTKTKNNNVNDEIIQKENHKIFTQFIQRITDRPNCRDQILRYNCSFPSIHNDNINSSSSSSQSNHAKSDTAVDTNTKHISNEEIHHDNDDDNDSINTDSMEPLWIRSDHRPSKNDIPKCPYCNTERQFEFQLMPQLLHYLSIPYVNNNDNHITNKKSLEQHSTNETSTTKSTTSDTNVVLDLLQQTETIIEQVHPTLIPPALVEYQQSIIEQRREQLLKSNDIISSATTTTTTSAITTTNESNNTKRKWNKMKTQLVNELLRKPHDWGIVAVYSCPNSCNKNSQNDSRNSDGSIEYKKCITDNLGHYSEEYVWVQPSIDTL